MRAGVGVNITPYLDTYEEVHDLPLETYAQEGCLARHQAERQLADLRGGTGV